MDGQVTNTAPLFSGCLERSVSHEHWRGVSRFDSLNQSAIPAMQTARDELERWYSRFPDQDGDLRSRFRGADHNHDGAFFELFLHELLPRLGLCVEVHPKLEDGRCPDFLVSGSAGKAFVEATYLSQPSTVPPLEDEVLNAIDDLDGDVPADLGLSVWVTGTLKQAPSLKPITQKVCRWLNGLARRNSSWHDGPEKRIPVDPKYGNLVLTLQAMPRSADSRVIQAWSTHGWSGSIGEEICKAVSKKARKYNNLDHPLVVAVNIASAGADLNEEDALFGQPALRLRRDSSSDAWSSAGSVRTGKALWFDNRKRRHHYPWLSAVMMFHNLAPWTVANVSACLYLNPYVDDRVPRELRTLGYAAEADGQLRRYEGDRLVGDVFGLPDAWPGSFGLGD